MGISKRQLEEKKDQKQVKKPGSNGGGWFKSVALTETEKRIVSEEELPIQECIDQISSWLEDGHVLSLAYDQGRQVKTLRLRSPSENWQDSRVLSVWHKDIARLFQVMAYGLRTRYGRYHVETGQYDQTEFDW